MRIVWLCLIAASSAACLLKADGFAGGPPVAGALEAGPLDSSTDVGAPNEAGASSDGGSVGTVLALPNGDFEKGCEGWIPGPNVTLSESTNAHTGAKACRVCMNLPTDTYVYNEISMALGPGERLLGELWVHGSPPAPADNHDFTFFLNFTDKNAASHDGPHAMVGAAGPDWIRVSSVLEPWEPTTSVAIVLVFDGNQGKCAVMDDAVLRRLP